MAFPVDSARPTTSIATAATSHAINVGSPAAGTLLIVFIRYAAAASTVTFTGYTAFASTTLQYNGDASDDESSLYYRWADGAEGATDTLTTTNSVKLAAICWLVTGAENPSTKAPMGGGYSVGTTTANTADPPARAADDLVVRDYLFIAVAGGDGESGAYTAAPTNYANLVAANSGTGGAAATNVLIGGASRQLNVNGAVGDNPGVFTHAAHTTGWATNTVQIRPSSTGGSTYTKASWAVVDSDGFGASAFLAGAAAGPAVRRQRRASRYLTHR